MKKIILFLFTILFFVSCAEDVSLFDEIDGKISILNNGVRAANMYDNQETASYELWVYKSGTHDFGTTVNIQIDKNYLESVNTGLRTPYLLLDSKYYSIPESFITLSEKELNGYADILFNPLSIVADLGYISVASRTKYALPLTIITDKGTINEDKRSVLIVPTLKRAD